MYIYRDISFVRKYTRIYINTFFKLTYIETNIHIQIYSWYWAEARLKIARMTLTIKRDGNWSSFQLANSALPLSVTSSAIAPSARMAPSEAKKWTDI